MPITNDLRAYADSAVSQGKQTLSSAQAQLSGVTDQASEFVNKFAGTARGNVSEFADRANGAVNDLRSSTEKLINVDALRTAIEPYLASLRSYGDSVAGRVDGLVATLKKDPRFGKVVESADSLSNVVVELVQDRVVKPVQSLAGGSSSTARKPSPKPTAKRTTKPAATRPATRKPAAKTTARKAPAKRTPSA
jgi:hypothetical protein